MQGGADTDRAKGLPRESSSALSSETQRSVRRKNDATQLPAYSENTVIFIKNMLFMITSNELFIIPNELINNWFLKFLSFVL